MFILPSWVFLYVHITRQRLLLKGEEKSNCINWISCWTLSQNCLKSSITCKCYVSFAIKNDKKNEIDTILMLLFFCSFSSKAIQLYFKKTWKAMKSKKEKWNEKWNCADVKQEKKKLLNMSFHQNFPSESLKTGKKFINLEKKKLVTNVRKNKASWWFLFQT